MSSPFVSRARTSSTRKSTRTPPFRPPSSSSHSYRRHSPQSYPASSLYGQAFWNHLAAGLQEPQGNVEKVPPYQSDSRLRKATPTKRHPPRERRNRTPHQFTDSDSESDSEDIGTVQITKNQSAWQRNSSRSLAQNSSACAEDWLNLHNMAQSRQRDTVTSKAGRQRKSSLKKEGSRRGSGTPKVVRLDTSSKKRNTPHHRSEKDGRPSKVQKVEPKASKAPDPGKGLPHMPILLDSDSDDDITLVLGRSKAPEEAREKSSARHNLFGLVKAEGDSGTGGSTPKPPDKSMNTDPAKAAEAETSAASSPTTPSARTRRSESRNLMDFHKRLAVLNYDEKSMRIQELEDELTKMNPCRTAEVETLKQDHEAMMKQCREEHKSTVDTLSREHEEEMQRVKLAHASHVKELQRQNEEKLQDMKRNHEKYVERLRRENEAKFQDAERDHESRVKYLQHENENRLSQAKKTPETLQLVHVERKHEAELMSLRREDHAKLQQAQESFDTLQRNATEQELENARQLAALEVENKSLLLQLEAEQKACEELRKKYEQTEVLVDTEASVKALEAKNAALSKELETLKKRPRLDEAKHRRHEYSPLPSPTPTPSSLFGDAASEQSKTNNIKEVYLRIKAKYDSICTVGRLIVADWRNTDLVAFGDVGAHLYQLRTVMAEADK